MGAVQKGVKFGAHDFVGEARGAVTFVVGDVCVVISKENMRWDVAGGLSSKPQKGQLVKGGAQVLCWFEEITSVEVITGDLDVCRLPTVRLGQVQGSKVEKFHSPQGANSRA